MCGCQSHRGVGEGIFVSIKGNRQTASVVNSLKHLEISDTVADYYPVGQRLVLSLGKTLQGLYLALSTYRSHLLQKHT